MKRHGSVTLFILLLLHPHSLFCQHPVILHPQTSSFVERFAAAELRRYLYLRSGALLAVRAATQPIEPAGEAILVAEKYSGAFALLEVKDRLGASVATLAPEEYIVKTVHTQGGGRLHVIAGGDAKGTLYGTYHFLEKMGIRFYLEGDVIPDSAGPPEIPELDETGKPLFAIRGIQPFHDFPEGPDWWNEDDYQAILAQLPKLGMNFFGLHTYPEGGPNAEPTVWIGLEEDVRENGTVRFSYPSSYQNTGRGNWGYQPMKTSDYHCGASLLFETDLYGSDVMAGQLPVPVSSDGSNEVFNRTAAMLRKAFTFARTLGVQTCVGTELPLTVPKLVQERLQMMGKDPKAPGTLEELYRGMFRRIMKAYPLDYYWFWTWEGWTWSDAGPDAVKASTDDVLRALRAAEEVAVPFKLATSGWVLGPPSDRTLFDRLLPKSVAVSCINREVGKAPVDVTFARIADRPKWAIPWLEDDPSLTSPQLWAGRMRQDAADALQYGCDGLLGIHWRTRILSPNIAALAKAAWDQSGWKSVSTSYTNLTGPVNGRFVTLKDSAIIGTEEPEIYKTIRDRVFGYRIPVPNGTYRVTLQFCEWEVTRKEARVFDIFLQGKKVLEKLDIFDRVGRFRALELSFEDIKVADGKLLLDFADRIHYPAVAGIIIRGPGFTRHIDCGSTWTGTYQADWPETPRSLPINDFYLDWAENLFGPSAARPIAAIFTRIDGCHPSPSIWTDGPGGTAPDPRPWEDVQKEYSFVDELASLGGLVTGSGNKERFAYWLHSLEYLRDIARLNCLTGRYNTILEEIKLSSPDDLRTRSRERLLPLRKEQVSVLRSLFSHLLATVSNPGEMGTIMNWEQHNLPAILDKPGKELEAMLGGPLPADASLPTVYEGPQRLFLPTAQSALTSGQALRLKAVLLSSAPASEVTLHWRPLGEGTYQSIPFGHKGRGVYQITLPDVTRDIEYYVQAQAGGETLIFPSTAPALPRTVVAIH